MTDLIVDTIGALIASILGFFSLKYRKAFFMDSAITKFIEKNPHIFQKIVKEEGQKGKIRKRIEKVKEHFQEKKTIRK